MQRREPHFRLRRAAVSRVSSQHCEDGRCFDPPRFVPLLEGPEAEIGISDDHCIDRDELCEILRQIPSAERHVIRLCFECGMSWGEIAESVGKKTEQVKSMFKRQKQTLRLLFREKLS